jgi:hypothetical protein
MKSPKQITNSTGLPTAGTIVIGSEQESLHSVLGFPRSGSKLCDFVVDMTRMQLGKQAVALSESHISWGLRTHFLIL